MSEMNYWTRERRWSRRTMFRAGAVGSAGLLGAALIGCGDDDGPAPGTPGGPADDANGTGEPAADGVQRGGELRVALTSNPQGWDPNLLASQAVVRPASNALGKLFAQQYGGDVEWSDMSAHPDHIESVEQVDEVTAVWHVHPGIMWPDVDPVNGREFNAEDVAYNLEVARESPGGAEFIATPVSSVEVIDEHTAQVNFEHPFAPFYIYLASGYQAVRAREVDDTYGDMQDPEALIGTGPWQLESYQPDQDAVFVPNPTYYKEDAPYLDRLVLPVAPAEETRTSLFQAGQLAEWETRDPSLFESVSNADDYQVLQQLRAPMRVWFQGEPWEDVRMRRALSMAMDYDSYIEGPLRGDGSIAYVFPPEFAGQWLLEGEEDLGEAARWHHYNPEGARQLIEAAGYGDGLEQPFYASDTTSESELALLTEWLGAVGINLRIELMPYAEWFSYAVEGRFEEGIGASGAKVFFDPDEWLQRLYAPNGSWNGGHVDDPVVNELIERQRTSIDEEERFEALADVQRHLADQLYQPFVFPNTTNYVLMQPEVMNWRRPEAYDMGRASEVVWLDT